ncbi:hypothetical protein OG824_32160 [Streptomyces prunicolor]|uniref:Transposase n=1 Tax=Streptomyces prunicolor TaxID=67348 RepID=A0ABU4FE61_9ACTN|nr:hypothetical protein [Streptomyces prunicolor]MCX5239867.1 hypothetical protein [Streptomyces prunicolor]MDV7218874.1 hypothetical protein [Streptomyces prunicolor]
MIDAITFKFQTGTQWAVDGTWERVFTALTAQADANEDFNWAVSVESAIVRVYQHDRGVRRKGPRPTNRPITPLAGPGRTDTKIRLAADARCRPLAFVLTAGQAGDAPAFTAVMARLHVPR